MLRKRLLGSFFLLLSTSIVTAGEAGVLPKIGDRVYLVDNEDGLYAPVEIKKDKNEKLLEGTFMKDPDVPSYDLKKIKKPKKRLKKIKKPKKMSAKPAVVNLKRMLVRGHMTKPRVEFDEDRLSVGRADEDHQKDFFQKVFDDLSVE